MFILYNNLIPAAVCVSLLTFVIEGNMDVQDLLADSNPMVVANAVAALADIRETSTRNVFTLNTQSLQKLLRALNECTEWGQVCTPAQILSLPDSWAALRLNGLGVCLPMVLQVLAMPLALTMRREAARRCKTPGSPAGIYLGCCGQDVRH